MLLVPVEPARQRDEEEMEWVECTVMPPAYLDQGVTATGPAGHYGLQSQHKQNRMSFLVATRLSI